MKISKLLACVCTVAIAIGAFSGCTTPNSAQKVDEGPKSITTCIQIRTS